MTRKAFPSSYNAPLINRCLGFSRGISHKRHIQSLFRVSVCTLEILNVETTHRSDEFTISTLPYPGIRWVVQQNGHDSTLSISKILQRPFLRDICLKREMRAEVEELGPRLEDSFPGVLKVNLTAASSRPKRVRLRSTPSQGTRETIGIQIPSKRSLELWIHYLANIHIMNRFTEQPPQLTAEERLADNSAYTMYLESYFGRKRWAAEAEADERNWVEQHHRKLYRAFQGDKLKEFWQTLAENFFAEYGPSHEGTRTGLSIHQRSVSRQDAF
ncbi:hypothetical protein C8J56DRAFT_901521 [Mycena floridula]|nr:hypothetical protein C8J56DRAFT_901521 [Mycena floridula]